MGDRAIASPVIVQENNTKNRKHPSYYTLGLVVGKRRLNGP